MDTLRRRTHRGGPYRRRKGSSSVFLDPSGNVVSAEVVRGKPVTVYYEKDGDQMVVSKVVVSQPVPGVTERTTTTETRREVR